MVSLSELLRTRIVEPLTNAQGSPESIARGGALGMWVALTPTVGIQMLVVLSLSVPFRANVAVGLAMCWITNPVTLIPFYFGFYWLGAQLLGHDAAGFGEVAERLTSAFGDGGNISDALAILGGELMWPMVVGSVVVATITSIPTYHVLLAVFRRRERRDGEEPGAPTVQEAGEGPASETKGP